MTLTRAPGPAVPRLAPTAVPWLLRVAAVSTLFGAEAIHTAVIDEHINEWLPFGLFFLALSVAEGMLAVALITAPSQWVNRLAIALSLGTVALWFVSRTLGLPIGPMDGTPEPIGRADAISSVLELITAAALFATATVSTATTAAATTLTAAAAQTASAATATRKRRSAVDYGCAATIVMAVAVLTLVATAG